jgi:glycosyltransferase involved in cell wall biosynthesis
MNWIPNPLICVVIAVKDSAKTIARAVESYAAQSLIEKQLVVVDGASSDGTIDILSRYQHIIDSFISERDSGIYDAMNKGVRLGRADWFYFLGADDQFDAPNALLRAADELRSVSSGSLIVYGKVDVVNDAGAKVVTVGRPWSDTLRREMRYRMPLCHQGMFHRRQLFTELGGYNTEFKIAGDHELLLRSLKHTNPKFLSGVTVAKMSCGGITGSGDNARQLLNEISTSCAANGVQPNSWRLALSHARASCRRTMQKALGVSAAGYLVDGLRAIFGRPRYWSKLSSGSTQ